MNVQKYRLVYTLSILYICTVYCTYMMYSQQLYTYMYSSTVGPNICYAVWMIRQICTLTKLPCMVHTVCTYVQCTYVQMYIQHAKYVNHHVLLSVVVCRRLIMVLQRVPGWCIPRMAYRPPGWCRTLMLDWCLCGGKLQNVVQHVLVTASVCRQKVWNVVWHCKYVTVFSSS